MGFLVRGSLVGFMLTLAGPAAAQVPTGRYLPAARFSISPEFAFAIHSAGGPQGRGVYLFLTRGEYRPTKAITGWGATGYYRCVGCTGSGWVNFAGLRFDFVPEDLKTRVVPYGVAAAGLVVRSYRRGQLPEGDWVPSGGLGLRLRHARAFAPRVELRYEAYNDTGYAILGVGLNVLIPPRRGGGD